jgi:tetratricopeptide (TPR) repeat protein
MKTALVVTVSVGCMALGVCAGILAKDKYPGIDLIRGKPAHEAGMAALQEAEFLAGKGTYEQIAVARVYYLTGDKDRAQAIIDRVSSSSSKPGASDWQRIGEIYADAGENSKADDYYQKALAADPKDDTGHAEMGAWYIRIGQRDKGEDLLAQAFNRNPGDVWHYVLAAEALLGVKKGR